MAAADGLRGASMSDYISREAMLEKAEYDGNYRLVVPVEAIKGLPAADVEPVRMGSGNGALKIGGSRLRATNALRAGLSITERGFAAFITAPTAAQKWKVVQTDDAVQR